MLVLTHGQRGLLGLGSQLPWGWDLRWLKAGEAWLGEVGHEARLGDSVPSAWLLSLLPGRGDLSSSPPPHLSARGLLVTSGPEQGSQLATDGASEPGGQDEACPLEVALVTVPVMETGQCAPAPSLSALPLLRLQAPQEAAEEEGPT